MFNISYEATLVAGQIGFSLHEETVPVVEPFAGWAMLTTQDTHLTVRNHIQVRQSVSQSVSQSKLSILQAEIRRRSRERNSRRKNKRRQRNGWYSQRSTNA